MTRLPPPNAVDESQGGVAREGKLLLDGHTRLTIFHEELDLDDRVCGASVEGRVDLRLLFRIIQIRRGTGEEGQKVKIRGLMSRRWRPMDMETARKYNTRDLDSAYAHKQHEKGTGNEQCA